MEDKEQLECVKMLEESVKSGEQVYTINYTFQQELEDILLKGKSLTLDSINEYEKELLDFLNNNLIGQEKAKKALAKVINSINKIGKREGVLSTLFFAGPTWVGKTEIAKLLAEFFTGDRENITIIQGAEYQDGVKMSNLFGSAKMYVGYGEPPILSETKLFSKKIKKPHPLIKNKDNFAIILIDEAEKMHPTIIQSLLGVLNEGKVYLSTGKEDNANLKYSSVTDLTNTIWIFTSNVGAQEAYKEKTKGIGFMKQKENLEHTYKKEFEETFSPEFRGRIDYFIVFEELKDEDIDKIIDLQIKKITEKLHNNTYDNIEIEITDKLRSYFKQSVNKNLGARNLTKLVSKAIEDNLAKLHSQNIIETAVIVGIKTQKKIIIKFDLKEDYENYEYEQDKIKISFYGEKMNYFIKQTNKKLVSLYSSQLENIEDFSLFKNHESLYHIVNVIKNQYILTLTNRENGNYKEGDYKAKLNILEPLVAKSLGELDNLSLKLLAYIYITKELNKKLTSGVKDLNSIVLSGKNLNLLAKAFKQNPKNFRKYLKNKLERNKKRLTGKLYNAYENLITNIEPDLKIAKKEKVIAITLMQLDYLYYQEKGNYLARKILEKIAIYLNEVY